ncbi:glycosyltransferase family 2 protein [Undibacterium sp. RuRC25W]|uniref:glycosyltransferase family 2 protein n=1 Tax=Undibacterium sp. RuRC25W TaxID=3413047 RepID=UPI003BF366F1
MDKLLTVVIPTFNRKILTDIAVNSVVTTFHSLVEIVVVDDCGAEAYNFGKRNSSGVEVKILRTESNVGAGIAREVGINQSSGTFIAFLDSDDSYDIGWIDNVIGFLQDFQDKKTGSIFISGIAVGQSKITGVVRSLISLTPNFMHLSIYRFIVIFFNPFYTPSIVLSRELCKFKKELRFCEDYFTTANALFFTDYLFLPKMVACRLGRPINSSGGESANAVMMSRGEMRVRRSFFVEKKIALLYKLFIPAGMTYQLLRIAIKKIMRVV